MRATLEQIFVQQNIMIRNGNNVYKNSVLSQMVFNIKLKKKKKKKKKTPPYQIILASLWTSPMCTFNRNHKKYNTPISG